MRSDSLSLRDRPPGVLPNRRIRRRGSRAIATGSNGFGANWNSRIASFRNCEPAPRDPHQRCLGDDPDDGPGPTRPGAPRYPSRSTDETGRARPPPFQERAWPRSPGRAGCYPHRCGESAPVGSGSMSARRGNYAVICLPMIEWGIPIPASPANHVAIRREGPPGPLRRQPLPPRPGRPAARPRNQHVEVALPGDPAANIYQTLPSADDVLRMVGRSIGSAPA